MLTVSLIQYPAVEIQLCFAAPLAEGCLFLRYGGLCLWFQSVGMTKQSDLAVVLKLMQVPFVFARDNEYLPKVQAIVLCAKYC